MASSADNVLIDGMVDHTKMSVTFGSARCNLGENSGGVGGPVHGTCVVVESGREVARTTDDDMSFELDVSVVSSVVDVVYGDGRGRSLSRVSVLDGID